MNATDSSAISRKHTLLFLALTFSITWAVEAYMLANGFTAEQLLMPGTMLILVAIMWIPGICALVVNAVAKRPLSALNLRFGSWKPYAILIPVVPLIFLASYMLTWALGLSQPDWSMTQLLHSKLMAPGTEMPPHHALMVMLPASALIGPFMNFLAGLGEELGWRGFLLPALLPMGKLRAYLVLGVIWGLWHAPLILVGFNYPGYPILGILLMCLGTIAIGAFINEFALAWQSTFVAAFAHAAINAQAYGVWKYIFPNTDAALGGDTGLTGIVCWSIAAIAVMKVLKKHTEQSRKID